MKPLDLAEAIRLMRDKKYEPKPPLPVYMNRREREVFRSFIVSGEDGKEYIGGREIRTPESIPGDGPLVVTWPLRLAND